MTDTRLLTDIRFPLSGIFQVTTLRYAGLLATVRRALLLLTIACTATFLAATTPANAQVFRPPQFTFTPPDPNNYQVVHLHVDIGARCFPDATTPGDGVEVQTIGSQIAIFVTASNCPNPAPPGVYYKFDVDLGPLSPGLYEVALWLNSPPTNPPPFMLLGTVPLQVTPIAVPTLAQSLIGLLLVLLSGIGAHSLRARRNTACCHPLAVLLIGTMLWGIFSPVEAATDGKSYVKPKPTSLIVLFDPRSAENPSPDEIIKAVQQKESNPDLFSSLQRPVAARKILRTKTPEALVARWNNVSPMMPRALAERYVVLTYASAEETEAAYPAILKVPGILAVEYNVALTTSAAATPTDQYYAYASPSVSYQWGMAALNMPEGWGMEQGTAHITAIDRGIYCNTNSPCVPTEDLKQNFRYQFSWSTDGSEPVNQ